MTIPTLLARWVHGLLLTALLLLAGGPAQAAASNLNTQWTTYWDTSAQMQVADVYAPGLNWQPDARQGMNGYRPGVLWAQFTVPATPQGQAGQLLSVGLPYLDQIDVYAWGQLQPLAALGDTRPVPQPLLSSTAHVVRLPALATPQRYLVRVQSTSAMNVRAQLLSDHDMLQAGSSGQFKAGVFVTLYLLSAIMYILGAVVMRQPVQLAYSFYLVCRRFCSTTGWARQSWPIGSPALAFCWYRQRPACSGL